VSGADEAAAAVALMDQLSDVFGAAVAEVLQASAIKVQQMTHAADPIVHSAIVNGGLIGILTYMAARSSEGRMNDPSGHLTSLFRLAGETWDGIRTGQFDGKVTLQ
jgi:hypothetical protein